MKRSGETRDPPVSGQYSATGRVLLAVSRSYAIVGGLVFVALVVMSVVSIVGRKLFAWPIPGDVEVLQMAAAFAGSTFFAFCHLVRGDVKVDFFTNGWNPRTVALLDAFGSLVVAAFGALVAWRTAAGALSLQEVGETSAILSFPVWIAQMAMVPGFVLLAMSGLYLVSRHLRVARRSR